MPAEAKVSRFRCQACNEMLVDVAVPEVTSTSAPDAAGYTVRSGCWRCERLKLWSVVKALWVEEEKEKA